MTAVCHGDKAEDEKHSGIRHSVFCSSHWCEGQNTESWMLEGAIPAKNALERQTSRLAHLSNAHLSLGFAVPAFSYPFVYAVHLTQKSIWH